MGDVKPTVQRCSEIADAVVPRYRDKTKPSLPCHGIVAKQWSAAYEAASMALASK